MEQLPPFPGFRAEGLAFLRDLAVNNEREWFKPRKSVFDDELIWPLRCLVSDLSRRFQERSIPLKGDPSKSLFRIYRDVRFSANKEPYKRHVAAVLSRSGSRKEPSGVYIHIEPGNCFVAGGCWNPDGKLLRALRERIVADGDRALTVVRELEAAGLEMADFGGALKRSPRGFESVTDEDVLTLIKRKAFVASRSFDEAAVATPEFAEGVVATAGALRPLLSLVWETEDR